MFFEVRILDAEGNLKKIISSKKLSARFWRLNDQQQEVFNKPVMESDEFELGGEWNRVGRNGGKKSLAMDEPYE